MRSIIILAAGIGLSGAAYAQSSQAPAAQNTPEGIVCAMTGTCDAVDGERVPVGNEKSFSLALPNAPKANAASPARTAASRMPRATSPRSSNRFALSGTPKVRPGGGLDMLVTFRLGSAEMTPQARAEARAFAQAMGAPAMAGLRFAIEGHTDATGSHDKNMALSQARAQSVVDYLVGQGVEPGRLTAKGYGPDRPVAGTRPTSPANRRVEFVKQA